MNPGATVSAPGYVIEAVDVTVGYGDLPAVRGLSLHVSPGEVVALFGPNGAGKSTTILALGGVLRCMRGQIRWNGRPAPARLSHLAREGLMLVPEGRTVTSKLSVRDNLVIGRGGVERAVSLFPELRPLLHRPAGLCSGGEQQMIVLARALAAGPRALLLDELSMGLAPQIVDRLLAAIRAAADEEMVAVLLVEQHARRALDIADRWYLLNGGTLVAEGDRSSGSETLELAYLSSMTRGPTTTKSE